MKKNESTKIPSLEPTFNPAHKVDLRIALDTPLDIHNKPKYGGFRSSDHRWGTTIKTVKFLLMKPNEPVM
jgi:hypothetical protein